MQIILKPVIIICNFIVLHLCNIFVGCLILTANINPHYLQKSIAIMLLKYLKPVCATQNMTSNYSYAQSYWACEGSVQSTRRITQLIYFCYTADDYWTELCTTHGSVSRFLSSYVSMIVERTWEIWPGQAAQIKRGAVTCVPQITSSYDVTFYLPLMQPAHLQLPALICLYLHWHWIAIIECHIWHVTYWILDY